MSRLLKKIIILVVSGSLAITAGFGLLCCYAGPQQGIEESVEEIECALTEGTAIEELDEQEDGENLRVYKNVCASLSERTKDCSSTLDSLIFTLQSIAKKAHKNKEFGKEKEALAVLRDYNSVIGDLKVMEVLLAIAGLINDIDFMRYFDLMAEGYEHLKGDFSLKNELFLERIGQLKDEHILVYARKLYSFFREYFTYDLWQDRENWEVDESQVPGNGDTYFDCSKHKDGPGKKSKNCPKNKENREER